jgi:hypothetical protein
LLTCLSLSGPELLISLNMSNKGSSSSSPLPYWKYWPLKVTVQCTKCWPYSFQCHLCNFSLAVAKKIRKGPSFRSRSGAAFGWRTPYSSICTSAPRPAEMPESSLPTSQCWRVWGQSPTQLPQANVSLCSSRRVDTPTSISSFIYVFKFSALQMDLIGVSVKAWVLSSI